MVLTDLKVIHEEIIVVVEVETIVTMLVIPIKVTEKILMVETRVVMLVILINVTEEILIQTEITIANQFGVTNAMVRII